MKTSDYFTILIAALALCAAIWNDHATRKHNRLSVKPHINIGKYILPDWSGIYLWNIGLGPAMVKSFRVIIHGEVIPGKSMEIWNAAIKTLGFGEVLGSATATGFQAGDTIPNGGKIHLIEVNAANISPNEYKIKQDSVLKFLKDIKIEIEYTSMYENEKFNCIWP